LANPVSIARGALAAESLWLSFEVPADLAYSLQANPTLGSPKWATWQPIPSAATNRVVIPGNAPLSRPQLFRVVPPPGALRSEGTERALAPARRRTVRSLLSAVRSRAGSPLQTRWTGALVVEEALSAFLAGLAREQHLTNAEIAGTPARHEPASPRRSATRSETASLLRVSTKRTAGNPFGESRSIIEQHSRAPASKQKSGQPFRITPSPSMREVNGYEPPLRP